MGRQIIKIFFFTSLLFFYSCVKKTKIFDPVQSGYPKEIGEIILNKCAGSGCHNESDKIGAGGVSFSTWNSLFEGGKAGLTVVPYRPDFSTLCYYINTESSNGPALSPTMPLNKPALSDQEYSKIKAWILNGAPDNNGYVKFSDDPSRKKIYVANTFCDVLTVFDSETLLPMRYVDVGKEVEHEFPQQIKISPNNNYVIVSFFSSGLIQKFDTKTDKLIGEMTIPGGSWSTFDICADSKKGYVAGNNYPGSIAYVDFESMSVLSTYTFAGVFVYPKGVVIDNSRNKVYAGTAAGNYMYVLDVSNPLAPLITEKILDGSALVDHSNILDPHSFVKTNDNKFCFINCEYSREIKMLDLQTNSVVATFSLPSNPQQTDIYDDGHLLFVACPEDITSFAGGRGSVVVIDYLSKTIVKKINAGFQSYGLAVDKTKKVVAVSNVNSNAGGPAPHHTTACLGRIGYMTFIDLNTLGLLDKRIEVAVYPSCVAVRN